MPKGFTYFYEGLSKKFILYKTKIVEIDQANIILNSGGWKTMHTKKCMNIALADTPYKVYQKKGQWYVYDNANGLDIEFKDNMRFERAKL